MTLVALFLCKAIKKLSSDIKSLPFCEIADMIDLGACLVLFENLTHASLAPGRPRDSSVHSSEVT